MSKLETLDYTEFLQLIGEFQNLKIDCPKDATKINTKYEQLLTTRLDHALKYWVHVQLFAIYGITAARGL